MAMLRTAGRAAMLLLVLAAGCGGQPAETRGGLGQPFELAVGQEASIGRDELRIRFVEVESDSRCPDGVNCIWRGEVSCLVEIAYEGTRQRMTLVQPGLTTGPSLAEFRECEIRFDVQPYPRAGQQTRSEDYRLRLTVNRKPAGPGSGR